MTLKVLAIVGLDAQDWRVGTFLRPIKTYVKDNAGIQLNILDARRYCNHSNPLDSLWMDAVLTFKDKGGIDKVIYCGNGDETSLGIFSGRSLAWSKDEVAFAEKWQALTLNRNATIHLWSSNSGGVLGVPSTDSIGRAISVASGRLVFTYLDVVSQSQRESDGEWICSSSGSPFVVPFG